MKHCHFSILYNEIAFLRQKLPFLYKHFDQIIFFDLNIRTNQFSNDGSHEFIRNFPDPEKKITLIEKNNLDDVENYKGTSFVEKQKMFAVGSSYVKDDIDYFWCTDMDEFFNESLIASVEKNINTTECAILPHIIFYKNEKWIISRKPEDGGEKMFLAWSRIARHKKGHVYGHCGLQSEFKPKRIEDECLFHFSHVGNDKVREKSDLYSNMYWYVNVWSKFDENQKAKPEELINFPNVHPAFKAGVKLNTRKLPDYIDVEEMMKDLKVR